jgi:uncharacterized protein YdeI (YjbR/CyaY-like superfamily)
MPSDSTPLEFAQREEWRAWLQLNHATAAEARLVLFNFRYRRDRISLDDAVEEALCFGWIDGKLKKLDHKRYILRFTPRRPGSVWSARNIARVRKLTRLGLMTEAGLRKVAQARDSRQWQAALERDKPDTIPRDLEAALRRRKGALAAYRQLSVSEKKRIFYALSSAKRPETRHGRIQAVVSRLAERKIAA